MDQDRRGFFSVVVVVVVVVEALAIVVEGRGDTPGIGIPKSHRVCEWPRRRTG